MTTDTGGSEPTIDLPTADWRPGDPCPNCGHRTVHAIVRAGVRFHETGSWDFDETLAAYEAFCPACDWLPPVIDTESPVA